MEDKQDFKDRVQISSRELQPSEKDECVTPGLPPNDSDDSKTLVGGSPWATPSSVQSVWKSLSYVGLIQSPPVSLDNIEQLQDRDDADTWKGWRRYLYYATPFITFANIVLYIAYISLRIACVVWAQWATHNIYYQAWVFVGLELAVALPSISHEVLIVGAMKKRARPKLRLKGSDGPTVDIFVTCCGEDHELVLDTIRAACDIDYPQDKFRVVVLDDGKSPTLGDAVRLLTLSYPNVFYAARPKYPGVPHHYKSGNLNYGLELVGQLPGGPAEYIAALDADMIPERHWLRALLPHLLLDSRMAMACPPQLFYNTPPSDPLGQSLDFFVHVIEPIKDAFGVAWCTGSGYVFRRQAIDDIGQFPLGSLAEDVATSTLMLGKGWKTAYVHEPLQFGTVPEDFTGHLKQRTRWAIGTVDNTFKMNFCLFGDKVRSLTLAQRFTGCLYACLNLYAVFLVLSIFTLPVVLVMNGQLIAYSNDDQLRLLIRLCWASTVCTRICELVLSLPVGYQNSYRATRLQLWLTPYIAWYILRAFVLPSWLGGQTQAFNPTGSIESELNERSVKSRKGMFLRLKGILVDNLAIFHLVFVYLTLISVVISAYRCTVQQRSSRDVLLCLVTHAFWPPVTFLLICSSLWTPVSYAIDPPSVPDREELLERDPRTQVAHPKPKSKRNAFRAQESWTALESIATTAYTTVLFVATFIMV